MGPAKILVHRFLRSSFRRIRVAAILFQLAKSCSAPQMLLNTIAVALLGCVAAANVVKMPMKKTPLTLKGQRAGVLQVR
jgi:hypothetical protein